MMRVGISSAGTSAAARGGHVRSAVTRLALDRYSLAAIDPDDSGLLYNVACIYGLLGEVEPAIDCLERALQCGFAQMEWIANDGDLAALRSHARFQALLAGSVPPRHTAST